MFMLDIETTGLDKEKDDVLEIGVVHMKMDKSGVFVPGESFSQIFPTTKEPSDWAKQHPAQVEFYDKCRMLHQDDSSNRIRAEYGRRELTELKKHKGEDKLPSICGLNVINFDLLFLVKKGFLREEDYSYRIFDVTPVIDFVMLAFNMRKEVRTPLVDKAFISGALVGGMPDGTAHGALWDCYRQIKMLNGFLQMARAGFSDFRL